MQFLPLMVFFGPQVVNSLSNNGVQVEAGLVQTTGLIGDTFGAINALFSGLALAGVIYTVWLQRKELELQRSELRLTRRETAEIAGAQVQQSQIEGLNSVCQYFLFQAHQEEEVEAIVARGKLKRFADDLESMVKHSIAGPNRPWRPLARNRAQWVNWAINTLEQRRVQQPIEGPHRLRSFITLALELVAFLQTLAPRESAFYSQSSVVIGELGGHWRRDLNDLANEIETLPTHILQTITALSAINN